MPNTEFNIIAGVEIDKSSAAKAGADAFKEAQRSFGAIKVSADFSSANKGLTDTKRQFNQLTESASDFGDSVERGLRRISSLAIASSALFGIVKIFEQSIKASKELEKNLQDINVVLQLPTDQIKDFGKSLFDVARQTKQSFDEVSKSALEFSRQGLSTEETLKRTQAALILVNLAGIDSVKATETITAALNSFTKENLKAIDVVNKLVAVDANYAVGSKDLAEAITRVGSTAQDVGVDFNKLIAIVTAAQQVTQRGGSVIGNAFKTIFQRLQRPEVLNDLEALGIQVREVDAATGKYTGNLVAADRVLADIAGRFKTLTQEQKAQVTALVAGNLQGNVFKGLLTGLTIEQEAYQTALRSGDAAIIRNSQLLETQDAKVKALALTLQQAGANVGQVGFGDFITKGLNGLNGKEGGSAGTNILGGILKNISGQGDEIGNEFGRIFIKSFSDILLGPGLVAVGVIGFKIAEVLGKFISGSAKQFNPFASIDTGGLKQVDRALNEQLIKIQEISSSTESKVVQEQKILEIFKLQNLQLAEQAAVRAKGGFGGFSRSIPTAADGLSEAFRRERNAISHGVGGASPSAQPVFLPHFKTAKGFGAVANTDEYLVNNFINSGYPAIFNKDMVRNLGMPSGAVKIASGGHIPNLASGPFDDDYASLFPSKPPKGNARIVKNIARVGGEPEILAKRVNQIKAVKPAALSGIITKDFLENLLNFAEGGIEGPLGSSPSTSPRGINQRQPSLNIILPAAPTLNPALFRNEIASIVQNLVQKATLQEKQVAFNDIVLPGTGLQKPSLPSLQALRSQTPGALKETISKEIQIAVDKFGKDVIDTSSTFKHLKTQASKLSDALSNDEITQKQFAEQSNKLIANIKSETTSLGQLGGQGIFKNLETSPHLDEQQRKQLQTLSTKSLTDTNATASLQALQKAEATSRTKLERIAQIDSELAGSKLTPNFSHPFLSLERASLTTKLPTFSEKTLSRAGNIGLPLTFAAPVVAEGIGSILSGGRDDITKERIQRGASTAGSALSTAGLVASLAPSLGLVGGTVALAGAAGISLIGIIQGIKEGNRDSNEDLAKRFQNLINTNAQQQQGIQGARASNFRLQELAQAPGVTKEQINLAIREALQASREISNPGIKQALRNQVFSGDISGADNSRISNLIAEQQIKANDALLSSSANVEKLQREATAKTSDKNFFGVPANLNIPIPFAGSGIGKVFGFEKGDRLSGFTQGAEGVDQELQNRLVESRVARINQIQNPEKRQQAIEDLGNRLKGSQEVFGQKPQAFFQNRVSQFSNDLAFGGVFAGNRENELAASRQPLTEKFTKIFGDEAAGDNEISRAINTLKNSTSTQLEVDGAYKFLLSQIQVNSEAYADVTKEKEKEKVATEKIFKNINLYNILTEKRNENERKFLQEQGQGAIAQAREESTQQIGLQRARIFGTPESQIQFQQLGNDRQNALATQDSRQKDLVHGLADDFAKTLKDTPVLKDSPQAKNLENVIEALGKVTNFDELNRQLKSFKELVLAPNESNTNLKEFEKTFTNFTSTVEEASGKFKIATNLQNKGFGLREEQLRAANSFTPNARNVENILNKQSQSSFLQGDIPFSRSEQLTSADQKLTAINDVIDVLRKADIKNIPENLTKAKTEAETNLNKADVKRQIELLQNAAPTNIGVINEGRRTAIDTLKTKLDNIENGVHNQAGIEQVQNSAQKLGIKVSDEEALDLFKKFEGKKEHANVDELYGRFQNLAENLKRPGLASGLTFKGGGNAKVNIEDTLQEYVRSKAPEGIAENIEGLNSGEFIKTLQSISEKGIPLTLQGQPIPVDGSISLKINTEQLNDLSSNILSQVTDLFNAKLISLTASLDVVADNIKQTNKQIGFVPAPIVQQTDDSQ